MRKQSYFRRLAFCALAFASCAAFCRQTQTELYYSGSQTSGSAVELSDASIWKAGSPSGEEFSGSVSETAENINVLNIEWSVPAGGSASTAFSVSQSVVAESVNMSLEFAGNNNWSNNTLSIAGDQTLSAKGDFNISASTSTATTAVIFNLADGAAISVGGDFNFSLNGGLGLRLVGSGNSGSLEVGGDMVFSGETVSALSFNRFGNVAVGGVLAFSGSHLMLVRDSNRWVSANRIFGGLSGSGNIELTPSEVDVNLTFTNAGTSEYSGALVKNVNASGTDLAVTMNASSFGGKQILHFSSAEQYAYDYVTYANADITSVSVANGELSIGMHSGMSGGYLEVNGAGAVFSAAGAAQGEVGSAYFDNAWLSAGKMRFDFSELDGCDRVVFENEMYIAGNFALELNIFSSDLGAWLEVSGVEYIDYTILEFGSTNIAVGEVMDMLKVADAGVGVELLEEDFASGLLTLRLSLAAVPEPAAAAAILGASALAFAARRRRD